LPLAAIVEDRILCLHGGIGASVKSIDDILKIKRPVEISHEVTNL
jgi:protein phosphatase